jgi:hypothetical protein
VRTVLLLDVTQTGEWISYLHNDCWSQSYPLSGVPHARFFPLVFFLLRVGPGRHAAPHVTFTDFFPSVFFSFTSWTGKSCLLRYF